jgi:hypothetical protein
MINRKFKTFETIARFKKLYEADEMGQDPVADPAADPTATPDEGEAAPTDATNPPAAQEQQSPELTDSERVRWAQTLVKALRMEPGEIGEIPAEFEKITLDNANKVEAHIESIVGLSAPLEVDNEANSESLASGLNSLS